MTDASKGIFLEEITDGEWGATFSKMLRGRLTQTLVILIGRTAGEALEDLFVFLGLDSEDKKRAMLPFITLAEKEPGGRGEAVT